jgi:transketolase
LVDKFKAFRWAVREVDGHDHAQLREALTQSPWEPGKPSCLIAHTIKGKGVDFMENRLLWHYRNPDDKDLAAAIAQIRGTL